MEIIAKTGSDAVETNIQGIFNRMVELESRAHGVAKQIDDFSERMDGPRPSEAPKTSDPPNGLLPAINAAIENIAQSLSTIEEVMRSY